MGKSVAGENTDTKPFFASSSVRKKTNLFNSNTIHSNTVENINICLNQAMFDLSPWTHA